MFNIHFPVFHTLCEDRLRNCPEISGTKTFQLSETTNCPSLRSSLPPSLLLLLFSSTVSSPVVISSVKSQHSLKHQMHFTPSPFVFLFPFLYLSPSKLPPLHHPALCAHPAPITLNIQNNWSRVAKSFDIQQTCLYNWHLLHCESLTTSNIQPSPPAPCWISQISWMSFQSSVTLILLPSQ